MRKLFSILLSLMLVLACFATSAQAADGSHLIRDIEAMLPVMDSVVRAIYVEGAEGYAPDDASFVWLTLYLMGVNWSDIDPGITYEEGEVLVPRAVMTQFAQALGVAELPAVPDERAGLARYDESRDAYFLPGSDMGESYTRVDDYNEDGENVDVIVSMYGLAESGEEEYAYGLKMRLARNDQADSLFGFHIVSVEN